MNRWTILVVAALTGLLALGCVKRSEYDAKVAEAQACSAELGRCGQAFQESQARGAQIGRQAEELKETLDAQIERANRDLAELQKQRDESTALNESLRQELERRGGDVDKLVKEKGQLSTALDQLKERLEELRRAQAAAERRAEAMRRLVDRFRKMADAGQLEVTVRRGRMVVQLPNDVLFDSGKAELKPAGSSTLEQVARILKDVDDRQFQIAGHTDNAPIQTSRFPSNWYLSSARAIRVVELLIDQGMDPKTLAASGYGEFDPIAPNDSPVNQARNRRIEIVIQPNVDELLAAGLPAGPRTAVPLQPIQPIQPKK